MPKCFNRAVVVLYSTGVVVAIEVRGGGDSDEDGGGDGEITCKLVSPAWEYPAVWCLG